MWENKTILRQLPRLPHVAEVLTNPFEDIDYKGWFILARARSPRLGPRPQDADEENKYIAKTCLIIFVYFPSFTYFWRTFGSTIINMLDAIFAFMFKKFQSSLFLLLVVVFSLFWTIYYRRKALLR